MAGLIDSFMQGYINRVNAQNGGGRAANNTLAAQNTASAFQRLQDAISQDYAQQQAQAKAAGQDWKMPSPTERFNDQVQAMILSGDPALQERGLALMTPDAMDKPTDFQRNFEYLKQANPNLSEMEYFKMLHPGPAQTRVNVNLPKQDQPMTFEDAQKLDWSAVPGGYQPGMSMMDAGRAGARLAMTKDQAEAGSASATAGASVESMEKAAPNTSPGGIPGLAAEARNMPGYTGQLINLGLNKIGVPRNVEDTKFITARDNLVSQVNKIMNSASATDKDRETVANMMPNLADDPQTREAKRQQVLTYVAGLQRSAQNKGGVRSGGANYDIRNHQAPQAPQAPKAAPTKRYNPATGKIEAIQ